MKKILIFSLAYYPRLIGGAEVAVHEITKRIAPECASFDMITLRFDRTLPRQEQIGAVRVFRIGFSARNPSVAALSRFPLSLNKYLFPFIAFFKALSLHRKNRYDSTWAIMANYAGFAALFFKMFHPRVPFVLTLQEGDPIPHIKRRVRFVKPLFSSLFRRADTVQAISHFLARFGTEMGAQSTPIVIPNGVDVEKFKVQSCKLKVEKEKKILITVSRLVKKNAVDDIIRALIYLPEHVHLWVLGEGPELRNLKLITSNLQLVSRVHFLGHKNHNELPRYLAQADIFVRPSLSEGLGNAFIEAMAAGVPVIGTPVGGIPDFLRHEETGLFCEVRKPESVAKAVARLFAEPILREKLIINGRKLAASTYEWNAISRAFAKDIFQCI